MINSLNPGDVYTLPLSVEAYQKYSQINDELHRIELANGADTHKFAWGSITYSASRFYKFMFANVECDVIIKSIWATRCLPKLKVFL